MNREPLGKLKMDSGNICVDSHQQSMHQLLQSCTALHAVANSNNNHENAENLQTLQLRKGSLNNNNINDENCGPISNNNNNSKDMVDLSQLSAIRKSRAPTMSRRNERERNRVRYLNFTFDVLRQHLPGKGSKGKAKKMSKVDTLRGAIDYIHDLQILLDDEEGTTAHSTNNLSSEKDTQNSGESEGDSLSPSGSPEYSGGSPHGLAEHDQMEDEEQELTNNLAGWFC